MRGACACLGPSYGEPYCPCEMDAKGLDSSAAHIAANARAEADLARLFGPGGKLHKPQPIPEPPPIPHVMSKAYAAKYYAALAAEAAKEKQQ